MIDTTIEVATLPKCSSTHPTRTVSDGALNKDRRGVIYLKDRSRERPPVPKKSLSTKERFRRAFSKALSVRTRLLGRKLSRNEWQRLKVAVRKQLHPAGSSQKRALDSLSLRVGRLDRLVPKTLEEAEDSIRFLQLQLSIVRQQMMSLVDDVTSVKETCPHFRHRPVFYLPNTKSPVYLSVPSMSLYIRLDLNGKETQLCCERCLTARNDTYFSWSGDDLEFVPSSFPSDLSVSDTERLLSLSPLAFQSVWSQVLTSKFRSLL